VSSGTRGLPSAPTLQGALQRITERLAGEFASPARAPPEWSALEWRLARAVAAMHGVSPLLSKVLRWQGEAGWADFLVLQRLHTASRHARIAGLLERIDGRTRELGIAAVALKGAALHALGIYAIGERPMADVDLLVRPRDAQRAARLLESLGYHESCSSWKERTFTPRGAFSTARLGEHSDNGIKIELHERICELLPLRTADISALLWPPAARPGLNAYPSRAALMAHLLLHAAGSMVHRSLRLVQLIDIARLASRMQPTDWQELLTLNAEHRLWWALPPLEMTLRYFPAEVPARVRNAFHRTCPRHLRWVSQKRTLSDVSYSYLWLDAFPGIEWSRSPAEALGYAFGRIRPSARSVALRTTFSNAQAWAVDAEWTRLSQSRRILRWLLSRQTRPVTMHVVRAALATPHA
jgi:hypothetical protein